MMCACVTYVHMGCTEYTGIWIQDRHHNTGRYTRLVKDIL